MNEKEVTASEPSKRPWTLVFFRTAEEPQGRFVLRSPSQPGGVCITMNCPEDLQEANGRYIRRACDNHDALVDSLREAANVMERMGETIASITGAVPIEALAEVAACRKAVENAENDTTVIEVVDALVGGGL